MTPAPENPPAFPSPNDVELVTASGLVGTKGHAGMTLRDYFAGQALAGQCGKSLDHAKSAAQNAAWAYQEADAMLAARTQPKPTP